VGGWPQLSDVGERGYWGQNPENRAMWAWFSLMHDGGGCFCIGGMLFGWDKVRLSGWLQLSGVGRKGYWGQNPEN
jgi:hypothetical protein